jgi:Protein of unknwon function (DUF3310)
MSLIKDPEAAAMPRFDQFPPGWDHNYPYKQPIPAFDDVEKPAHYAEARKFEPAQVIIDWKLTWCLGNAVKYISRAGRKGSAVEDLQKAMVYIRWEIKRLSGEL